MSNSLVSVVIPTYYRNDRLREAIKSAQSQTYNPVEIIVVDGSEEERNAESVAKEMGVEYICPKEDRGAHAARSLGAKKAKGEYVNFLDDDDRLVPVKIEKQVPVAEESNEVGVVYSGIQWENDHPVLPDPDVSGDVLKYALMFQMTPSSPSTMLIDADVLEDILPFENLHGADDMGMKIELAKRSYFEFVDDPLVRKGHSEESLGGSEENIDGRLKLLEQYAQLYKQFPDSVRRTALAHTYLLDAELTLNNQVMSLHAIQRAMQACYVVPGWPLSFVGFLFASLFGRPGRDLGKVVYSQLVLGDKHRGKLT
ncbi:glycosyltransferase family 2 protein [Halostella sp. JP-L12]|uniref:glycosyltransferase family 2 protein n=1 Tax=Halostella TaxID=1843185 RepID=UPI0013CE7043|nr:MULTISPECIES: glycosyltransferase family 2 protein [Halostella]NHN46538.1 glycosyltransferase family 2 protein [Halostella sp. JP-L12]